MIAPARAPLIALVSVVAILLTGCVTTPSEPTDDASIPAVSFDPIDPVEGTAEVTEPPAPANLWEYIAQQSSWSMPRHPEGRAAVARALQQWRADAQLFPVLNERASPLLQYVVEQVEARGLPIELALMPILESTLDPWAYSSQRAAGLWQITPTTGTHFGLPSSWWYDARYDVPAATDTALDYLTALHQRFEGNWLLALAAYNAGPSRVERALRKRQQQAGDVTFWSLPLPAETRRYVPKLLALLQLIREPDDRALYQADVPIRSPWQAVATGGQIELARAAALADLDEAALRQMNAGHLRWATAPDAEPILWVPADRAPALSQALAQLPDEQRVEWQRYVIQPGDSLLRIAEQFGSDVALLQAVNGLSSHLIRAGDPLLIPRGGAWAGSLQLTRRDAQQAAIPSRYRVQRGDSLWTIARRYNLSVDRLERWNRITPGSYLQPGQTLRLRP